MNTNDFNSDIQLIKLWIENQKKADELYLRENSDSLIPFFEAELRSLGFVFEISSQPLGFMPKHKDTILPIAIKYYLLSKEHQKYNEQNYFMAFFHFKAFEEVVPMLIQDFYSPTTPDLTRWFISDCLFQIESEKYINEYLNIVSNSCFGINRQMIILLLGKQEVEQAIPTLIELLEDETVRLHAITALGKFKKQELRCYFERFQNSDNSVWRTCAKTALKKLDN